MNQIPMSNNIVLDTCERTIATLRMESAENGTDYDELIMCIRDGVLEVLMRHLTEDQLKDFRLAVSKRKVDFLEMPDTALKNQKLCELQIIRQTWTSACLSIIGERADLVCRIDDEAHEYEKKLQKSLSRKIFRALKNLTGLFMFKKRRLT
jgi:hypothetical protein